MDRTEARELTDKIAGNLSMAYELLISAYKARAWEPLDYESWDAYCAAEFGKARMVRLSRQDRQAIVSAMAGEGMSTRVIASGLGVSAMTVSRDLDSGVTSDTPATTDKITGQDGKDYPRTPKRPVQAPVDLPKVVGTGPKHSPEMLALFKHMDKVDDHLFELFDELYIVPFDSESLIIRHLESWVIRIQGMIDSLSNQPTKEKNNGTTR